VGWRRDREEAVRRLTHLWRLLKEFGAYTWEYKAWWVMPIILVLLLLGLVAVTGSTVLSNLYALF